MDEKRDEEKTAAATRVLQSEMMNMERALIQAEFIGDNLYEERSMCDEEIINKLDAIEKDIKYVLRIK